MEIIKNSIHYLVFPPLASPMLHFIEIVGKRPKVEPKARRDIYFGENYIIVCHPAAKVFTKGAYRGMSHDKGENCTRLAQSSPHSQQFVFLPKYL